MNLKLKAVLQTAAVFASAVIFSFVVDYIGKNVDAETLRTVLGGAILGGFAYMVYQWCLSRLEYQDKFDDK
jgi:xanthine/uracil permease